MLHERSKLRRKLAINKERNWLLAITMNSFAKLSSRSGLTDLERIIVDAYRKQGFKDDELREWGKSWDEEVPREVRRGILPAKFADLNLQSKYDLNQLKQDLPEIEKAILAMPNSVNIDLQAVHAGRLSLRQIPGTPRDVLKQYAASLVREVEVEPTEPEPQPLPKPRYTIKALKFHCSDETGPDWCGSDEPYWIFVTAAYGVSTTSKSKTFADVDSGDTVNFATGEGYIWAPDGQADVIPDGEVGAHVQLWEHDSGDPETVRAAIAATASAAAGILAATGVGAWISAIVAGVAGVLSWLAGFLNDDHIADFTYVFTGETLGDRVQNLGSTWALTPRFADGDGDYTLTLLVARAA